MTFLHVRSQFRIVSWGLFAFSRIKSKQERRGEMFFFFSFYINEFGNWFKGTCFIFRAEEDSLNVQRKSLSLKLFVGVIPSRLYSGEWWPCDFSSQERKGGGSMARQAGRQDGRMDLFHSLFFLMFSPFWLGATKINTSWERGEAGVKQV